MQDTPCTYRLSVKAIIRDGDKILLIREKDGLWELPGGGLEHGEDPRKGLMREVFEETGYDVYWTSGQPEAFWSIRKDVDGSDIKWFAFVAYSAKISGKFRPNPATNDEAQEAKYFNSAQTETLQLHDNTKPYFLG